MQKIRWSLDQRWSDIVKNDSRWDRQWPKMEKIKKSSCHNFKRLLRTGSILFYKKVFLGKNMFEFEEKNLTDIVHRTRSRRTCFTPCLRKSKKIKAIIQRTQKYNNSKKSYSRWFTVKVCPKTTQMVDSDSQSYRKILGDICVAF